MKKTKYPASLLCDFYKVSHKEQYPKDTQKVFATWTSRATRIKGVEEVVCFGVQAFIKEWLIDYFNEMFFSRPKDEVVNEYERLLTYTLGSKPNSSHIAELHDLGYLPIKITALKEGTLVPIRVPMLTIENTDPRFFWLTNYLETIMSAELWLPMTSATIALEYRKTLQKYAVATGADLSAVPFQGHDFSMRGMGGFNASYLSGMGHLLSFTGTDSIPSIMAMENYYNANVEKELVASSIPATEHSVQCAGGKDEELETYKRLINEVYPSGFVSIVSDTWDFWNVIENYLPKLKDDIMKRDGRVVIRPDSGNPVDILCGTAKVVNMDKSDWIKDLDTAKDCMRDMLLDQVAEDTPHGEYGVDNVIGHFCYQGKTYEMEIDLFWNRYDKQYYYLDGSRVLRCDVVDLSAEEKGLIESLWDIFGGTITDKGYKQLDTHIGAIYGDAITMDRSKEICERLYEKGFCSTNVVLGIGSFTYQYNTRDTFGFALKTTYAIIDGEEKELFKDPKTDNGVKRSQRGLVAVQEDKKGKLIFKDGFNKKSIEKVPNLLEVVFEDGKLIREHSLAEIRERIEVKF